MRDEPAARASAGEERQVALLAKVMVDQGARRARHFAAITSRVFRVSKLGGLYQTMKANALTEPRTPAM
ncbi:hypothetical protein BGM19_12745 [Streptomyces agglomeratus]|nr:hypothetical protein BGM19_12745 [Streptomyces agglomeratus]